jgi:hypothetical protein
MPTIHLNETTTSTPEQLVANVKAIEARNDGARTAQPMC